VLRSTFRTWNGRLHATHATRNGADVRPEPASQTWDIQVVLVPVIPKLVREALF
jgi:hypothetical protein